MNNPGHETPKEKCLLIFLIKTSKLHDSELKIVKEMW